MVPHLIRAKSAYKGLRIHSFYRTHTHTLQIYAFLVMGWDNEKKENNKSAERREEVGFQFWLKRRMKENAWSGQEESSRSQIRSIKRLSPPGSSCPSKEHERSEQPRLSREHEGEQRWSNWERCGRAVLETMWMQMRAILYWIWLLIGSQWRS